METIWPRSNVEESQVTALFDQTRIRIGDSEFAVLQTDAGLTVNGVAADLPKFTLTDRLVRVDLGDRFEEFVVNRIGEELRLIYRGREFPLVIETERDRLLKVASRHVDGGHSGALVRAAMPGLVVRLAVKVGDVVKRSDPVVILEAMKMENEIRSPIDGVVKEIKVRERDSVEKSAVLVILE